MSRHDDAQSLQQAFSLHRSGRFAEAAKLYRKVLKRHPREPNALHSLALIESAAGNLTEAAQLMARSLAVQPDNIQFIQNYVTVLCQLGRFETAGAECAKGLGHDRGNVYLHYVLAGALLKQGKFEESLAAFDRLLALEPHHVPAMTERGSVLLELGRLDAARESAERAIALQPGYAEAYLNKGILLGLVRQHAEALASFDIALKLNPTLPYAWSGRGNVLFDLRRLGEAGAAYERAIGIQPKLAEGWLGLGNVFFELKRFDEALAAYDRATGIQPNLAAGWLGRGNVLFDLRRFEDALAAYDKALAFDPESAEAFAGRGNVFSILKRHGDALAAYDKAFSLKPDLTGLEGDRIRARFQICDWEGLEADCEHLVQSVRDGKPASSPFAFLGTGAAGADELACARAWTSRRYPASGQPLSSGAPYAHDRIRIAYVSADFREHPVSYLITGVFERHDRARFDITGISIGADDGSPVRRRLEKSFDRFIDASALGIEEIARRIREGEIDILVDLNGFTQNARPQIFARRPAPLQVNYLGFPGTMGADYIDYIIADPVLSPEAHRANYKEKVVRLPHSYLPHDAASRVISEQPLARRDYGLPERGFVFCCFNNAYKLNPRLFASRMRILKAVEGSVLWLSRDNDAAIANLRKHAQAAGIDPSRLVFADRVASSAEHLARHRLADLFLDTLPYNAHTTASDALWAGLPVLTEIGGTFAGRVAASLLTAIGLPELIAVSEEEFERLAVELANDPVRLAAIGARLAENRHAKPLFDTSLYVSHLEQAYEAMVGRLRRGQAPDHIDLTH
jgi:predicted O-linked N-acetylglucosamine transferase (SPINDLY family)